MSLESTRARKPVDDWSGEPIPAGETRDVELAIGESYSGMTVKVPIRIRRAAEDGPVVFVTAALHGDEINGTGAVRGLLADDGLELLRGSLILIPVLNLLAFDRHSRYLPDRRDLNRCFPGSARGTLAGRMARAIFDEIVARADFGVDLHTAAIRRTNYPAVRGDLKKGEVRRLAAAFGSEVVVDSKGPKGSLRREATRAGCPTIIMEGGEVWKVEPAIVETAIRGVKNVLRELGMLAGPLEKARYQATIRKSQWIRAERGGFLQFHVTPGDLVEKGEALATNTNLLGREQTVLKSPFDAVVMGMTTLPAVSPGEPVCHLGKLPRGAKVPDLLRQRADEDGLEERVVEDLASSVLVVERDEDAPV